MGMSKHNFVISSNKTTLINQSLKIWKLLSKKRKFELISILILIIMASLGEAISIGAVLPFLAVLTSPEKIFENDLAEPLIDFLNLENPSEIILPITLIFSIIVLISGLVRILLLWKQTRVSWDIGGDFAIQAYERTLYQPYMHHISRNSSEILEGTAKARELVGTIVQPIITMIGSTTITIVVLFVLFSIDPIVTFSSFLLITAIYSVILKFTKTRIRLNSKTIAYQQNQLTKTIQEGLGNIRDVLIDKSQSIYASLYKNAFEPFRKSNINNQIVSSSPRFFIETIGIIMIAGLAYFLTLNYGLSNNSEKNNLTSSAIPILGTLALGAQRLLPLLQQIFASFNTIRSHHASIDDALILLEQPMPKNYYDKQFSTKLNFKNNLVIKNLSFKYSESGPWILKQLNLKIPKGSRVGFIGKTGSGKSTILDIIMGLLKPTTGSLLVDNLEINETLIDSWQANISHVPQEIFLSDTTIAENIALGVPPDEINFEKIYESAKKAKISNAIENLTNGYNTLIGERGVRLSGGQRQRIGIARAFYKKSDVIILDEATSALDHETETLVMKSIEKMTNITLLMVTHRLTSLKFCDFILEITKDGARIIKDKQKLIDSVK